MTPKTRERSRPPTNHDGYKIPETDYDGFDTHTPTDRGGIESPPLAAIDDDDSDEARG